MRGFVWGSFALIVLGTVVQKGVAEKIGGGLGLVNTILAHALSPSVPLIPNLSGKSSTGAAANSSTTGGSSVQNV